MARKRDSDGKFTRLRDMKDNAHPLARAVASAEDRSRPPSLPANRMNRARINLKAVAEVLAEQGLDPAEEIIRILRPTDPETGEPERCKLDEDVQARILNELLQYTQPKLKSIEVRAKVAATSFDVNDVQARIIAEEFLRAATKAEAVP